MKEFLRSISLKMLGVLTVTLIIASLIKLALLYTYKEVTVGQFDNFTLQQECKLEIGKDKKQTKSFERIYQGCLQSNTNKEDIKLTAHYLNYENSEVQLTPFYNLTSDILQRDALLAYAFIAELHSLPNYSEVYTEQYELDKLIDLGEEKYTVFKLNAKKLKKEDYQMFTDKNSEFNIEVSGSIKSNFYLIDNLVSYGLIVLNSLILIFIYHLVLIFRFKRNKGTKKLNLISLNIFEKENGFFIIFVTTIFMVNLLMLNLL